MQEEKEQTVSLSALWETKERKTHLFSDLPGRPGKPLSPAKQQLLVVSSYYRAWFLHHTFLSNTSPFCPSAPGSPVKKQPSLMMENNKVLIFKLV